jgi:2-C-methyl-D-erythritol 2,4-cyclodiphosphate synthase
MFKVGFGYDVHRFKDDGKDYAEIILCNIKIPHNKTIIAHSDGDVAIHALIDAILGAACIENASDIGELFPDTDEKWKNQDSAYFLKYVLSLINENGYQINNIDITIACELPKISSYKNEMRKKLSSILNIETSNINIKATTTEKLGFEGRKEGISAYCVVSLIKI